MPSRRDQPFPSPYELPLPSPCKSSSVRLCRPESYQNHFPLQFQRTNVRDDPTRSKAPHALETIDGAPANSSERNVHGRVTALLLVVAFQFAEVRDSETTCFALSVSCLHFPCTGNTTNRTERFVFAPILVRTFTSLSIIVNLILFGLFFESVRK